jgi:hypothetical protein
MTESFILPDLFRMCPFPLKINVHYAEVERASEAWFDSYRIIADEKRDKFYAFKFCLLIAMTYPEADAVLLRNVCDLLFWMFTLDDFANDGSLGKDVDGARTVIAQVMSALHHPHTPCALPIAESCRDWWERTIETASEGWQRRFVESTGLYLKAVSEQVANRAAGEIPSIEDFIELRRDTSAVRPFFAMIEYGLDLPDEVLADPIIKDMQDCINDACKSDWRLWRTRIVYRHLFVSLCSDVGEREWPRLALWWRSALTMSCILIGYM